MEETGQDSISTFIHKLYNRTKFLINATKSKSDLNNN